MPESRQALYGMFHRTALVNTFLSKECWTCVETQDKTTQDKTIVLVCNEVANTKSYLPDGKLGQDAEKGISRTSHCLRGNDMQV